MLVEVSDVDQSLFNKRATLTHAHLCTTRLPSYMQLKMAHFDYIKESRLSGRVMYFIASGMIAQSLKYFRPTVSLPEKKPKPVNESLVMRMANGKKMLY